MLRAWETLHLNILFLTDISIALNYAAEVAEALSTTASKNGMHHLRSQTQQGFA